MANPADLLQLLRIHGPIPAAELLSRLGISRPTLSRLIRANSSAIVARGKARRTAYAARRQVRGQAEPIPLYRIDAAGHGMQLGWLDPIHPHGYALSLEHAVTWPLDDAMRDGWFEGLPYLLDDMRPQGFLGRNFARQYGLLLQVPDDPAEWSEDDALHALTVLGADTPGDCIIGEAAYRRHLQAVQTPEPFLSHEEAVAAYPGLAQQAMAYGVSESSAGGEFPKFTARRLLAGEPVHVLVKFSGDDPSPGTQRWSDLLVCEHLALETIASDLHLQAARSCIYQVGGRTFLEVQRFDRHGAFGRSPTCTWAAMNSALFGLAGKSWIAGAEALHAAAYLTAEVARDIARVWHFGQLIANSDMHDGNLSFRPGLQLAPVYDMLPMLYAPMRGVELPAREFAPPLPLPQRTSFWRDAARAAEVFWARAAADKRISASFREICADNAQAVHRLVANPTVA